MKVNYQYNSPSMCIQENENYTLGLSPDISRDEIVSFSGKLKHPLIFRDAMLMLRDIVVSDARQQKKERTEYFTWLMQEIENRILKHEKYLPGLRKSLRNDMDLVIAEEDQKQEEIDHLIQLKSILGKEIEKHDAWRDYYKLEHKFWRFIKSRDMALWFVLDPVITVHADQVTFEAFSMDESIYGCLSIDMDEFELNSEPKLGTTNIDFSYKLAQEMMRFRTYSNVELSVNPQGFTVDSGVAPKHVEKKIDLPETWVKGFNQVSSAANLNSVTVELSKVDMYDICSFLRKHKEKNSPRYMKWILEKDKPVRIIFEPFKAELILTAIYHGEKNREEKIWGRRRWLIIEKLLPIAKKFQIKLLGFGMPQFIIADLGKIKMTIGFSSWSANDWVKGTAFHIMSGFIGEGCYSEVYHLLQTKRSMSMDSICKAISGKSNQEIIAGIGSLLKRGEGYFDPVSNTVRFRKLYHEPIPKDLYKSTQTELEVTKLLSAGMDHFTIKMTANKEYEFHNSYPCATQLTIDGDGQISKLNCSCQTFKKGSRNISSPCQHILALYIRSAKFTKKELEPDKVYKINDYLEMLL